MGRIVTVTVVDLTRPIEQKGFKSMALIDFTVTEAMEPSIITDTKSLTAGSKLEELASKFFANGGQSLVVAGKKIVSANEISAYLTEVHEKCEFYGLTAVMPKASQAEYVPVIQVWVEGNKKLGVLELNGTDEEIKTIVEPTNSDRLVIYANSKDVQDGKATATCGICMPQDEGSITWGNKVVTGVPNSGYTAAQETRLLDANINYITTEIGLVITQFGRTTSGSNADITRSKDWLENRCAEALTSTLINNKKVPFTTPGMAMISSSLNQVGVQAVDMGMLDSFVVLTPMVSSIPQNDKANRVLRGVKFIATLSGAVETIEMELQVKL